MKKKFAGDCTKKARPNLHPGGVKRVSQRRAATSRYWSDSRIILMDEWYFAYGNNLYVDQKAVRTRPIRTGEERPRLARLVDYRFAFNKQGSGTNLYANIVPCPSDEVIGVIYRCSSQALAEMDKWEGGYERRIVTVVTESGE